jgi:hypothetical protein
MGQVDFRQDRIERGSGHSKGFAITFLWIFSLVEWNKEQGTERGWPSEAVSQVSMARLGAHGNLGICAKVAKRWRLNPLSW